MGVLVTRLHKVRQQIGKGSISVGAVLGPRSTIHDLCRKVTYSSRLLSSFTCKDFDCSTSIYDRLNQGCVVLVDKTRNMLRLSLAPT